MVNGDFAKLTRKHGIKISAGFACTVEEIGLAVGEKVGHGSIKSLARMNSAVVIFLDQVEKVNCVIETGITRKGEFSSLRQWWDHGKTEIRLLCQQHTLNVTQDIIRSMKDLESDIVELETISETTGDRGYIEILKEKKMALANLLDVKVQGALVRSRFLNTNEMDAPTSFFFGLEKKNGQRRVIHSLLSGTGQEITEPSQIRRRAVSFYSTLYTSEYEEGETLSEGFCNGLPQVSEEANSQLEGPLTIQELQTALQGMQGRRAPGIDGLSVEFYKAYWDVLSHDLLDVFNESLASGSMPVSCRRAVITLLPKKGNLQDIKNWRPVSLLCVDYKILSKALATRLGKAVEQVIHRDQTYCVPGRSMVDNVHLIRDVLEVSSSLGINTGLISLDQEKAFDRVEHSFLWKVMEKFGFSAGFIAKIKVLYNKIESVLKFNARLDVSSSETPGLTVALCRSKTLCLQQLVDAVGPELSDAQALGSLLGLHSVRVAQRILQLWSQILCPEEKRLLRSYGQGRARPDPADPFPEIYLSPGLGELTGPLLQQASPAGCQACFCFGHSLACSASTQHGAINITSHFIYHRPGWLVGEFSGGQQYPLLWKEGEVYLLPLDEQDTSFYKAPGSRKTKASGPSVSSFQFRHVLHNLTAFNISNTGGHNYGCWLGGRVDRFTRVPRPTCGAVTGNMHLHTYWENSRISSVAL
ncbi:hypothetical protein NHX12_026976 [Muraenolepis orangiensis]|uniref:Reverse transcriptase domain-containing protein n=1 Tax=Muraenolepis orangiensis TaxID=630683 RepID=A0A9Q0EGG6_9TELE|nr:hypothetical protein NHX12_026976 [Muraenolepis orangiensis]